MHGFYEVGGMMDPSVNKASTNMAENTASGEHEPGLENLHRVNIDNSKEDLTSPEWS
jgi:hypothetical protein